MRLLVTLLGAVVLVGIHALPQTASAATTPAAILAQAKQAAGGDAWDSVHSLHIHSQTLAGGRAGTQDKWDDVQAGRYAVRSQQPPETRSSGFDGVSVWTQARGGYSYVLGDEDARQGAINEAYQTCRAFWFPERANATLALSDAQQEGGHTFDVIQTTPQAGLIREATRLYLQKPTIHLEATA